MKKIYIILFLVLCNVILASPKSLSTLKNLKFLVEEKTKLNNKERQLKYSIIFDLPNKIRKEIIFPEINKGEIYVYNDLKKIMYLPVFDEYKETEINGEENQVIQAVNKIIKLEQVDKKFRAKYFAKKEQEVFIDEYTKLTIKKYTEKENYILPKEMHIEDSLNNIIADIILHKIGVNQDIKKDTFILEKEKKF